MTREFKDFLIYEPYDYLNSEITGDYDEAHAVKCVNGTFVGTEEIFTAVQQMWTNFARCGNPSTDRIEWKAYSADDQNVLNIAGPDEIRIE